MDGETRKFTVTNSATEFSALKIQSPEAVAVVDKTGRAFVYTLDGDKKDTGVFIPMPLPLGQDAVYEVIRSLGLALVDKERELATARNDLLEEIAKEADKYPIGLTDFSRRIRAMKR